VLRAGERQPDRCDHPDLDGAAPPVRRDVQRTTAQRRRVPGGDPRRCPALVVGHADLSCRGKGREVGGRLGSMAREHRDRPDLDHDPDGQQ
jgi:hypothetical protein